MRKSSVIKKEMLILGVIKQYPETIPLFLDYGLHCIGCSFAKDENIEEAVRTHQLDLEKFLEDLNKTITK
jgi:hybrid cluster-associated redox disulfide protein